MDAIEMLAALEAGWATRGVEIDASILGGGSLHIQRIQIEKGRQGQGLGTRAMKDLVELADRFGLLMTLSPSTDFGGTSIERLKRFYRRFGFVSNKGRHRLFEITESMYRLPRR